MQITQKRFDVCLYWIFISFMFALGILRGSISLGCFKAVIWEWRNDSADKLHITHEALSLKPQNLTSSRFGNMNLYSEYPLGKGEMDTGKSLEAHKPSESVN